MEEWDEDDKPSMGGVMRLVVVCPPLKLLLPLVASLEASECERGMKLDDEVLFEGDVDFLRLHVFSALVIPELPDEPLLSLIGPSLGEANVDEEGELVEAFLDTKEDSIV